MGDTEAMKAKQNLNERDRERDRGRRKNREVDGEIQRPKESPEKLENMMADHYKVKLIKI